MMTLAGKVMDDTSPQLREGYERSLTRLSHTYLAQMDALTRYRAKAQQTVRVERVDVHESGQAIVGAVTHGGRGDEKKVTLTQREGHSPVGPKTKLLRKNSCPPSQKAGHTNLAIGRPETLWSHRSSLGPEWKRVLWS